MNNLPYIQRYRSGEVEEVCQELLQASPRQVQDTDAQEVLTEIFSRLRHNLHFIHDELQKNGYLLKTEIELNSDRSLLDPLPEKELLLTELSRIVRPYGFVPESLKTFYRIVGSCDFSWDYSKGDNNFWTLADPIQVISLDDLVSLMKNEADSGMLDEIFKDNGFIYLPISADYYHKDNISGGPMYALKVSALPSFDSELLYEEHETSFICYLRISMENCGFARIAHSEYGNDYEWFFEKVSPTLIHF